MRSLAAFACLALFTVACGVARSADAPRSVSPPEWLAEPSFEDLAKAYPEGAIKKGLNGRTEISCAVTPDGHLDACSLVSETPQGEGFGQASLSLATKFRVRPGTFKPTDAGETRVSIPIRWLMINNPNWLRTPSGDDFASEYPSRPLASGVSGTAVMRCRVEADGTLAHCFISSESPLGLGFGEATLRLARKFRMTPAQVDGQPVEGGVVVIPVNWRIAGEQVTTGGIVGLVLTEAKGDERNVKRVSCGTTDEPKRMCAAHTLTWLRSPEAPSIAQVLNDNRGLKGASELICTVGRGGDLANCAATRSATPVQQAAMQALSSRLEASPHTQDGIPVIGAQIFVVFNWDELAFEARLAHQKVR